jgi:23S rRNA (guanosine2251-2'-O)-methyltransferase
VFDRRERRQRPPAPSRPGRLTVGLQPVREAIRRHGAALREVLIDERASVKLDALQRFATDQGVPLVTRVSRAELDQIAHGVAHQGTAAYAPDLVFTPAGELDGDAELLGLALDSLQDPQNFGAVVRSAVALGSATIIWGEHASAPLSLATFRASAGAIEHARLCRVPSLHVALGHLADGGVAVVGLDPVAPVRLSELDLTRPTVLVLGGEGEGLGRAVRRSCTTLTSLGGLASVDSLNASVAAGIALYEALRQRMKTKT